MIRSAPRVPPPARRQGGFTVVELAVVAAMIAVLTTMILPLARYSARRQDEIELRYQLRLMRDAIDMYKLYSDRGMIPLQIGSEGYPPDLKTLVEGVTLVGQLDKKQKFLRRIPTDPMTKKAEWGLRSFQDDPDSIAWGGQNVYDVFSLSDAKGIDGTYYKDW
jgi:general secretion pathway protein G